MVTYRMPGLSTSMPLASLSTFRASSRVLAAVRASPSFRRRNSLACSRMVSA